MRAVVLAVALFAAAAPAARAQEKKPEVQKERDEAAEARAIAQKAAHFEKVYRDRVARIDRLQEIYREKGAEKPLAELKEMRAKLEKRHANAMEGFRKQLGEGRWAKVEKHIEEPGVVRRKEEKK